jgi:hypothetical protein
MRAPGEACSESQAMTGAIPVGDPDNIRFQFEIIKQ